VSTAASGDGSSAAPASPVVRVGSDQPHGPGPETPDTKADATQRLPLDVIGVGLGRTGTTSLAAALERLGFGPCYKDEALWVDAPWWRDAIEGAHLDWDEVLGSFRSIVDWPAALVWRRLVTHFPEARVVLTVRDPDVWYDSMVQVLEPLLAAGSQSDRPELASACSIWYRLIIEELFEGQFSDRAHATRVFRGHVAAVKDGVAPGRLLVQDCRDGWAPLCHFLETPVPPEPFPQRNSRTTWIEPITREVNARHSR
jgi:Sulfotransferase domain